MPVFKTAIREVYDMRFELNKVEARRQRYPSTISFLNLFVYDHVFGPLPQRAYADPCEKWHLIVACLQHFRMILSIYDIKEEDIASVVDQSQLPTVAQSAPLEMQLPVLELLKDFMSGKTVFRNIMGILLPGVNVIIADQTSQIYGQLLERAVHLSLEIIIHVLEKDLFLADYWRPLYQMISSWYLFDFDSIFRLYDLGLILLFDNVRVSTPYSMQVLETLAHYEAMILLITVFTTVFLQYSNASNSLVEDYAACLELRSEECQMIENSRDDTGVLIIQLLIDNINRPAPNVTHLLLKFDMDMPVEWSGHCLKVILDILENLSKPDVNALLHEFGFQLLYELCLDPLACGPIMDLLSIKKYQFFLKHLHTIGVAPLPKRNNNQIVRISSLHQRAWLLKLLALELHTEDMTSPTHREMCQNTLSQIFVCDMGESELDLCTSNPLFLRNDAAYAEVRSITKTKVLKLLDVFLFRSPDTSVENILGNPSTSEKGGVYYYSERGDRLIDLASFRDRLWQLSSGSEAELRDLRESIQHLLRWGWQYNKNLEEQAAQLHMLSGWAQMVEVALTCMAKLRDERFLSPGGLNGDSVTCLDVIMVKQLSNSVCHSILFKLVMAILRHESSEALRRLQYALSKLLSVLSAYARSRCSSNSIAFLAAGEAKRGG
ncbi:hypothetical protein GIB67_002996 [Kingdonia uniflora]|uniref:Uncharacterized protein n=1 Tax=Kingdonia uniflora TaxID=39325 RepID=A0A7J7LYH1_9MAGN|nr:hypothetical protein GIB67_002996 [Kingdonia uniflora]